MLLITTENSKLYSFTLNNIYVVDLLSENSSNLQLKEIKWNPNGAYFTVSDGKSLIIGQPEIAEEEEQNQQSFTGNNSVQESKRISEEESYHETENVGRSDDEEVQENVN